MFHVTSENNIVDGYSRTEDKPPSSSPYYLEPHLTRLFGKVPEDVYLGPHPYDCVPTQQHWSQVVELAGAVPDIEAFSSPEQPPLCSTRWSARDDFFRQLPATPPSSLIYANPPFPMLPQVIQALQSWNGTAVVVAPAKRHDLFDRHTRWTSLAGPMLSPHDNWKTPGPAVEPLRAYLLRPTTTRKRRQ